MQIRINEGTRDFKPISLTLNIETKRELEFLLCLANSSHEKISIVVNDSVLDFDIDSFECGEDAIRQWQTLYPVFEKLLYANK